MCLKPPFGNGNSLLITKIHITVECCQSLQFSRFSLYNNNCICNPELLWHCIFKARGCPRKQALLSSNVRHLKALSRPTLQMKTTKVFRQHCLSPLYIQNRQQLRIKQQGSQNLRKVKHRDGSGGSKHKQSITTVHNTT